MVQLKTDHTNCLLIVSNGCHMQWWWWCSCVLRLWGMGSRGTPSTRASSKMVSMHFARSDSLSIAGERRMQLTVCTARAGHAPPALT